MRMTIEHRAVYRLAGAQAGLVQALRLTPPTSDDQTVVRWRIDVDRDARMRPGRDGFGNAVTMLYVDTPLDTLAIEVTGEVLTSNAHGVLRGVAELRDIPSSAPEAAFSLERPFQGQGHGARLFASLVDAARNAGIPRFTLQCLRDNVAMQRIARRHAAQLRFEDGEVTAELLHPGGDLASLAREATEERFAFSLAAADRALYRLAAEVGVDLRLRAV